MSRPTCEFLQLWRETRVSKNGLRNYQQELRPQKDKSTIMPATKGKASAKKRKAYYYYAGKEAKAKKTTKKKATAKKKKKKARKSTRK